MTRDQVSAWVYMLLYRQTFNPKSSINDATELSALRYSGQETAINIKCILDIMDDQSRWGHDDKPLQARTVGDLVDEVCKHWKVPLGEPTPNVAIKKALISVKKTKEDYILPFGLLSDYGLNLTDLVQMFEEFSKAYFSDNPNTDAFITHMIPHNWHNMTLSAFGALCYDVVCQS